jgi:hypothetical protein
MIIMLLGGIRGVIRFGERPRRTDLAHRIVENFLRGADTLIVSRRADRAVRVAHSTRL